MQFEVHVLLVGQFGEEGAQLGHWQRWRHLDHHFEMEQRAAAEDLNRWYGEGKWKPMIGQTFPLAEAAATHQLQEDNTLGMQGTLSGKIVLET